MHLYTSTVIDVSRCLTFISQEHLGFCCLYCILLVCPSEKPKKEEAHLAWLLFVFHSTLDAVRGEKNKNASARKVKRERLLRLLLMLNQQRIVWDRFFQRVWTINQTRDSSVDLFLHPLWSNRIDPIWDSEADNSRTVLRSIRGDSKFVFHPLKTPTYLFPWFCTFMTLVIQCSFDNFIECWTILSFNRLSSFQMKFLQRPFPFRPWTLQLFLLLRHQPAMNVSLRQHFDVELNLHDYLIMFLLARPPIWTSKIIELQTSSLLQLTHSLTRSIKVFLCSESFVGEKNPSTFHFDLHLEFTREQVQRSITQLLRCATNLPLSSSRRCTDPAKNGAVFSKKDFVDANRLPSDYSNRSRMSMASAQ